MTFPVCLGSNTRNFRWDLSNCRYSGLDPCLRQEQPDSRITTPAWRTPAKTIPPDGTQRLREKRRTLPLRAFHRRHVERQKFYENGTDFQLYPCGWGPDRDTLHITEGAMKADIASFLSGGELFIGLTGVQNTRYLEDVVRQLKPKRILECVDMDCRTNPHVQRRRQNPRGSVPRCARNTACLPGRQSRKASTIICCLKS